MSSSRRLVAWVVLALFAWLAVAAPAAAEDDESPAATTTREQTPVLAVLIAGPTSLAVRWTAPPDNGDPVTGYELQRSEDGEQWGDVPLVSAFQTHRDRSLTMGQRYWYRVRAVSEAGPGAWSGTASAAPASRPGMIADLAVTDISDEALTITWSIPAENGSPIIRYELERLFGAEHKQVVGFWAFTDWPDEHTTFAFAVPNPLEGPGRAYRIRAWNALGDGEWSEPVLADTGAATPARSPSLAIIGIGPKEIRLDWAAPEANGSDIFAHQVERRHAIDHLLGYDYWSEAAWVAGKTWTAIEVVFHDMPRTFRVRSWNNVGQGEWSPWAGIQWGLITVSGLHEEFRGMLQEQCPGGFEILTWTDQVGGVWVPYSFAPDGTPGLYNPVVEALNPDGFDVTPLFVDHCRQQTYFEQLVRGNRAALTVYTGGVERLYHALETDCAPGAVAYANATRGGGGGLAAFSPSLDAAGNAAFEERFRFHRLWNEPLLITGCGP